MLLFAFLLFERKFHIINVLSNSKPNMIVNIFLNSIKVKKLNESFGIQSIDN